jgi:hypothetical protein
MTPMIVLFCMASGAVLVGIAANLIRAKRQRKGFEELCGDWWPRFEAEFRAYAERWEATRGIRTRTVRRRPAQDGPTS